MPPWDGALRQSAVLEALPAGLASHSPAQWGLCPEESLKEAEEPPGFLQSQTRELWESAVMNSIFLVLLSCREMLHSKQCHPVKTLRQRQD